MSNDEITCSKCPANKAALKCRSPQEKMFPVERSLSQPSINRAGDNGTQRSALRYQSMGWRRGHRFNPTQESERKVFP